MPEEMLHELLTMQKEVCERDARIETQVSYMDKRLQTLETLSSKMSETLNEQRHLSTVVDTVVSKMSDMKEKSDDLIDRINANTEEIKELKVRIGKLEVAPQQKTYEAVRRIVWIAVPVFITALCTAIIFHIKKIIQFPS